MPHPSSVSGRCETLSRHVPSISKSYKDVESRNIKSSDSKNDLSLMKPLLMLDLVRITRASRDPDDNVVLATAITGRAKFLVTNDRDLLELSALNRATHEWHTMKDLTAAETLS